MSFFVARPPLAHRWDSARRRRLAVTISIAGLGVCVAVAGLAPGPSLIEPLTPLLAATAVVASLAYVDVEGTLLTDSSFVPFMVAAAFLGPTAVFAIAVTTELATWAMYRYRPEAALVNVVATGGPLLIASGLLSLLNDREGADFYLVLAAAGALELVLNAFLVVSLIGLIDGRSLSESVSGWRKIVAPFLFNILLAVAAASVYSNLGAVAVVVVLATIVSFRYLVGRVFQARIEATRAAELAKGRGRLMAQALDAEDREKRRLSERLHDGPVQILLSAGQDLDEARAGDQLGLSRASRAVQAALSELRSIVFELHPSVLSRGGLVVAVQDLAEDQAARGGFAVSVQIDEDAVGPHDRLVFSVARELLVNAARHANASKVSVGIRRDPSGIIVSVEDNGRGMAPEARAAAVSRGHIGLASLEERVDAIGGSVVLVSDSSGTRAVACMPVPADGT